MITVKCAGRTQSEAKLKYWSLEQRKVYCRAMQGDEVAHALKSPELPEGFRQNIFKGQVRGRGHGVCDQLVHSCLIGW